ncbi:MAG: phytanoyl-CoA dioxygenase family protein, partial [candidate division Zixibacteria bacterium]|nr:phytanoyl-CoA dioxygenase family protein [candidate division Zixibacteria bacterium]
QDFTLPFHGAPRPFYLWHFVCLDDVSPENGATWIIPGSHRATDLTIPAHGEHRRIGCGSAFQVCAKAGDIISLNPCCYHTPGINHSRDRQRRYLAVQMCYATLPPIHDHWAVVGPKIHAVASPRLKKLLGGEVTMAYPHASSGYILPEGWEISGEVYCEGKNVMGQVPAAQLLRRLMDKHTG